MFGEVEEELLGRRDRGLRRRLRARKPGLTIGIFAVAVLVVVISVVVVGVTVVVDVEDRSVVVLSVVVVGAMVVVDVEGFVVDVISVVVIGAKDVVDVDGDVVDGRSSDMFCFDWSTSVDTVNFVFLLKSELPRPPLSKDLPVFLVGRAFSLIPLLMLPDGGKSDQFLCDRPPNTICTRWPGAEYWKPVSSPLISLKVFSVKDTVDDGFRLTGSGLNLPLLIRLGVLPEDWLVTELEV